MPQHVKQQQDYALPRHNSIGQLPDKDISWYILEKKAFRNFDKPFGIWDLHICVYVNPRGFKSIYVTCDNLKQWFFIVSWKADLYSIQEFINV